MKSISIIFILFLVSSCGQINSKKKSLTSTDTTMLDYPTLVFDANNQCRLHLHDPNDKNAYSSYSGNYVAVKYDDLAKEIYIESSKNGKEVFYNPNTSFIFSNIDESYLKNGYKFFWIDTNGIYRRLRVIDKTNFNPTSQENFDTLTETIWTENELYSFKSKLKFNPKDYYDNFLLKNEIPKFTKNYDNIEKHELTMKDYYAIFQREYPFTYPRCHPFCFLAYKQYENFTQFYIHNYIEAAGYTIYLIHLNDTGMILFNEPIWHSIGDGGDYLFTKSIVVNEFTITYIEEEGYWNDNPDKPEYRKVRNCKLYFDKIGILRKKDLKEQIEGKYPHN